MVFTVNDINSDFFDSPMNTSYNNEELLAAELARINAATSHAAELHLLQVEHAKQLLLHAKEAIIHAREKHSLELEQMKELHQLRIRKLEVGIKRINSEEETD
ncbi:uncharacterized protein LOC129919631 [Episyrphus balteatus]|uniref:uncharacterized protein LOC129919631 n=1 Tax=Episyrphus balteatus TaxID=286459 RepID=UPI00248683F1|nr:uncharacterized protein LOC129919631 [Episyrphus balteatus]